MVIAWQDLTEGALYDLALQTVSDSEADKGAGGALRVRQVLEQLRRGELCVVEQAAPSGKRKRTLVPSRDLSLA